MAENLLRSSEVLVQLAKKKRFRKAIVQPAQTIATILSSESLDIRKQHEALRTLARALKDAYSVALEQSLDYAVSLLEHLLRRPLDSMSISIDTKVVKRNQVKYESVCCALLNGVLDYLETKPNETKSSKLSSALYKPLASVLQRHIQLLSDPTTAIQSYSSDLLFTICSVFRETAEDHLSNQQLLCQTTVLGPERLGILIRLTKGSAALEELLQILGISLPRDKKTADGRSAREAFIRAAFGDDIKPIELRDSLRQLVMDSGKDWAATSDQLIALLAKSDPRFPRPFPVGEMKIGSYTYQLDSFYVDEEALTMTTVQDSKRETFRIRYTSITTVNIEKAQGMESRQLVTLHLHTPPILAVTSLQFPGRTPPATFLLSTSDTTSFRDAFAHRTKTYSAVYSTDIFSSPQLDDLPEKSGADPHHATDQSAQALAVDRIFKRSSQVLPGISLPEGPTDPTIGGMGQPQTHLEVNEEQGHDLLASFGNLGPDSDEDAPSFRMASTPDNPGNNVGPSPVRPLEVVLVPSSSPTEAQVQTPTGSIHEGVSLPTTLLVSPKDSSPIPSPTNVSRKLRHNQVFGDSEVDLTDPSEDSDYCPSPRPNFKTNTIKASKRATQRNKAPAQRATKAEPVKPIAPPARKTRASKQSPPKPKSAAMRHHSSAPDVEPPVDASSSTAVEAEKEAVIAPKRKPTTQAATNDARQMAPDPKMISQVHAEALAASTIEMGSIHAESRGENKPVLVKPVRPNAKGPRPKASQAKTQTTLVAFAAKRKADAVDGPDSALPDRFTATKRPRIVPTTPPHSSPEPNIKSLASPAKKRLPRPRRISTTSPTKSIATVHKGNRPDLEPLLPSSISSEAVAQSAADVAQDLLEKLLKARDKQPDIELLTAAPILSLKQAQSRKINREERENVIPRSKPAPTQLVPSLFAESRPVATRAEIDVNENNRPNVSHMDAPARHDTSVAEAGREEPSPNLDARPSLLERRKAKAERAKQALDALKAGSQAPAKLPSPAHPEGAEKEPSIISVDSDIEPEPIEPLEPVTSGARSKTIRQYGTSARVNPELTPAVTTEARKSNPVKTDVEARPHKPTSILSNEVKRYVTPVAQYVRYQDIDLTPRSDDQFLFALGSPGTAIEREAERRIQMRRNDATRSSTPVPKIARILPIELTSSSSTEHAPPSAPTARKVAFSPEVIEMETVYRPVEEFVPRQASPHTYRRREAFLRVEPVAPLEEVGPARKVQDHDIHDISKLMHEITDALVDQISRGFDDVQQCALEGRRRVLDGAMKKLTDLRGDMIEQHSLFQALEQNYANWSQHTAASIQNIEKAQARVVASAKKALRAHDRNTYSMKVSRSLISDNLPASLR